MVRSLGGWSMIKKLRLKGQDRIKGDERILGDGEFVTALLSEAKEKFERGYKLKKLGISCTDLAKQLGMSQPGVGFAVNRGEKIAKEHKYQLF